MTGWIALRFLADPATALKHFAHVDDGSVDPIVLARAAYWRGRAAEAIGQFEEMHAQYEAAAHYPTAYYGQLARARLGIDEIVLQNPPSKPIFATARAKSCTLPTFFMRSANATSPYRSCVTSPKRAATLPP